MSRSRLVPSMWPPLAALAVVVLLSLSNLGVDLVVADQTARQTSALLRNSMRSVEIVGDLRAQANTLAWARLDRERLAGVASMIARDLEEYAPLVSSPREHEELDRLQGLLQRLQHRQYDLLGAANPADLAAVEHSLDRLININEHDASRNVGVIQSVHRKNLASDAVAGGVTVVLALGVGVALIRSLRNQARIAHEHLEQLESRRSDLEAFAGRVAHDLRGPLAPIQGYADLLRLAPDRAHEVGPKLARASERMSGLIDELLALSVSGTVRPGATDVAPVVREVAGELFPEAQLELAEVCVARCTTTTLRQILVNLISNAVKYRSPDRPLAIRVATCVEDGVVQLVVEDNGIGMAPETAAHVFEPYYRARDVKAPGHGLGLAIVKRTADALGGSVAVASRVGHGTTITVRLPAA